MPTTDPTYTDLDLLRQTARGDDLAARLLWQRHAPWIRAYAASIAPDSADDLLQRAFCTILDTPAREIDRISDARAWICRCVRNDALNLLRARRREADRRHRLAPANTPTPIQDSGLLASALSALPRRLREVLLLRHKAGLTFDQMALALNTPRSTLASRHDAAIARLRVWLAANESSANAPDAQTPTLSREVHHA